MVMVMMMMNQTAAAWCRLHIDTDGIHIRTGGGVCEVAVSDVHLYSSCDQVGAGDTSPEGDGDG